MEILILTQPLHTNYGGLLQAYALQQILKGMGHDVVTDRLGVVRKLPLWNRALRFLYHAVQFCILKNYRYYPYRYLFVSFDKESKAKRSISINTERFVNTYIDTIDLLTRSNESVIDAVRQFDAIVVGSDQVWRATMSDIPTYFLSFTKAINVKRIAYAASFGTDDLNEYSKMDMKIASESIKLFDAVSVREKSGVHLCRDYFKMDAVHVLDPTMLLSKDDYLKLIEEEDKPCSENILLTYVLDRTQEKNDIIQRVGEALHLTSCENGAVKYFSNVVESNVSECIYPSVSRWVAGFRDAQFVVTDSFHGTVFSIIFNKPFVAILNSKRGSSRFISLLSVLGLENRLISTTNDLLEEHLKPIDYTEVNKILNDWRYLSISFMERHLKEAR
ncbi:polysaccharide pyruvyl transferase family protein [Bacteroides intestinalis]|jgi:hypothetical protein|uniref:polysaccharide pyruvyl transferase family protein n=1 Tax=Bacteroides intestinalis TaxID=329854 RepID=UPI000E1C5661|nr:polysaccharide pyruvyl transferase family protein [Bacteroides intestinalis]QDO71158.1 polysaccharide pyruvyl transferase family protein [Bacteroides intestinalis]UCB35348.1 polysaccharide pyruvyl transferase family protein [Bacteroides intestinalis]UCB39591.1 polysaccharide pyruvyl transferase family protein [Bacteroides intestinalis]